MSEEQNASQKPLVEDYTEFQRKGKRHKILYSHIILDEERKEKLGPPPVQLTKAYRRWGCIVNVKLHHEKGVSLNGAFLNRDELENLLADLLLRYRMEKHGTFAPEVGRKRVTLSSSLFRKMIDRFRKYSRRSGEAEELRREFSG